MYRTLLTIALISMACGIASAQPHGSHRPDSGGPGHNPAARLIEELDLSQEQSTQVEAIFAAAREQHDAANKLQREEHCTIRAAVDTQLMEVFTAAQQTQFEELKQYRGRHRPDSPGRRKGHRGPPLEDC